MRNLTILFFCLGFISLTAQTYTISGQVRVPDNNPVCNAIVTLSDGTNVVDTYTTTDDGLYAFTGLATGNYTLTVARPDVVYLNGVSTFDIVNISRHILGVAPVAPYLLPAMDVNLTNTVTIADMVLIRRLILGITQTVPGPVWYFFAEKEGWPLPGGSSPASASHTVTPLTDNVTLNFYALKTGDVNHSVTSDCQ